MSLVGTGLGVTLRGRPVLREVDVVVAAGRVTGVVGESGAGKSTLVRLLAGLRRPGAGAVTLDGAPVRRPVARRVQLVAQDPYSSLNPRHTVGRILGQPLAVHRRLRGAPARAEAAALLDRVGLAADALDRRPAEFSGGQRQRIAIARALSVEPGLLLLDEPLSALDAASAEGILALLDGLRTDRGLGYLLVSHDLGPVRRLADDVLILREGRVVEQGPAAAVLDDPAQDYTKALLRASAR